MMTGMDSMMAGMGVVAWLVTVLLGVLLIALALVIVRAVSPKAIEGGPSALVLIILAVIGVLALLGVGGMFFMHWGMGGMNCCG